MQLNWIKVLCVDGGKGASTGEIYNGALVAKECGCRVVWVIKGITQFKTRPTHPAKTWCCKKCEKEYEIANSPVFTNRRFIPLEDSTLEAELRESLTLQTT